MEKEWERRTVAVTRAGLVMESQLEKKKKQLAKELAEQNRQLAAEQRARSIAHRVDLFPPLQIMTSSVVSASRKRIQHLHTRLKSLFSVRTGDTNAS